MLLVADDPLARLGLQALLANTTELTVVSAISGRDDPTAVLRAVQADVAVWDADDHDTTDDVPAWTSRLPTLAVAAEDHDIRELAGRTAGVLGRAQLAQRIGPAVVAVAAGLHVMDLRMRDVLVPSPAQSVTLEAPLTQREHDVLLLIADGLSNKQIAGRLGVSANTVKFHVGTLLFKLDVSTRTAAVVRAAQVGLLRF